MNSRDWTIEIFLGIIIVVTLTGSTILHHKSKISPSFEAGTEQTRTTNGSPRLAPVRRSLGFFEVTAYCPCERCCGDWSDGVTASGHVIRSGDRFVAADRAIPFGKTLDVPGYGEVKVLDRGGKIRGKRLDAFFPTHAEALEWGRQTLEIYCWVEN